MVDCFQLIHQNFHFGTSASCASTIVASCREIALTATSDDLLSFLILHLRRPLTIHQLPTQMLHQLPIRCSTSCRLRMLLRHHRLLHRKNQLLKVRQISVTASSLKNRLKRVCGARRIGLFFLHLHPRCCRQRPLELMIQLPLEMFFLVLLCSASFSAHLFRTRITFSMELRIFAMKASCFLPVPTL